MEHIKHAATGLAALGRGEDSMLVHMTPHELYSLQNLANRNGGSLTINPHTGLPEAGFLSTLLPMVIGAGLMATGIGAPAAALMVGAGDTLMTGSLKSGIMAGLGAWGGAGMAESLATAGTANAVQAGSAGAANEFGAGAQTAQAATEQIGKMNLSPELFEKYSTNISNMAAPTSEQLASNVASAGGAQASIAATQTPLANMQAGLSNAQNTGAFDSLSNFGKFAGNNMAATGLLGMSAMQGLQSQPPTATGPTNPFGLKSLASNFSGSNPAQPNPPYQAQYPNYKITPYHAKQGGLLDIHHYDGSDGSVVKSNANYADMLKAINEINQGASGMNRPVVQTHAPDVGIVTETDPKYMYMDPYQKSIAQLKNLYKLSYMPGQLSLASPAGLGAISNSSVMAQPAAQQSAQPADSLQYANGGMLGTYSDGGHLLKGPGDGVSDDIPATIGGHTPARLADGEFVIPARIVSELGNGSTDAGAKRLYQMMDRIKSKRAKSKNIAADNKAYKYLPA